MSPAAVLPAKPTRHLARLTFVAFLFTFIASRTLVILIMTRRMPDLFLHLGGTHVHHLNYGIFLLAAVAGVLLFAKLNQTQRSVCAVLYGLSMALTFDEFGMWLHLGGSYWQRASFDAVIVLLGLFGTLAFLPRWQRVRTHHFVIGGALLIAIISFYFLLFKSLKHANDKLIPHLMNIEQHGPS
jgi:glucose dehydrogenase